MKRQLGLFLLALCFTSPAFAENSACDGGRYVIEGGVALFEAPAVIVVTGDRVTLESAYSGESCGEPDKSRIRRRGDRLRVRARWRECGPEGGRVRLRLRTDVGCETAKAPSGPTAAAAAFQDLHADLQSESSGGDSGGNNSNNNNAENKV